MRDRTVQTPVQPRAAEIGRKRLSYAEGSDTVCASLFDEHAIPNEHPTKGWNRASITFRSVKPYRPKITAKDREIPRGRGLRMLALCAATGTLLSVTLMWFVLFVVGLYKPLPGSVDGGTVAGVAVVLTLVLYAISARRDREFS